MEKINISQAQQFVLKPTDDKENYFYIRTAFMKNHSWRMGHKNKTLLNHYSLIGAPIEGESAEALEKEFQIEYLKYLEREFKPFTHKLVINSGYHRLITQSGREVMGYYAEGNWAIPDQDEKILYIGKETLFNN